MTFKAVKNIGLAVMVGIMAMVSFLTHIAMRPVMESNIANLSNIESLQNSLETYRKFQQASLQFERLIKEGSVDFSEPAQLLEQITRDLQAQKENLSLFSEREQKLFSDLEKNARLFQHAVFNYQMELAEDPMADNRFQMEQASQLSQKRFSAIYSEFIEIIRQKDSTLHGDIVDSMERSNKISLVGLIILIFSSIIVAILLSQALNRPLKKLVSGIKRLSAGDLDFQFENISKDEIGALQQSFNTMASSLRKTMVSRDSLDDIIHSMVDSLIVFNTDGTIQLANEPTVKMLNFASMDDLLTRDFSTVICLDSPEKITFEYLLKAHTTRNIERSYISAAGDYIPVLFSSSILRDHQGEAAGLICLAKDDTERKRAAEKQRLLEEGLYQTKKMEALGTLAGGIAHDFNNLLTVIVGYCELIKMELPDDSPSGESVDEVLSAARRASGLVQQILSFSRKSQHKMQIFSPHFVVKEALKMLRASLPTTVEISSSIDMQCGYIHADPTKIHQVVMNLCTNAFHAMANQKGKLTVSLRRSEVLAEQIKENNVSPGDFIVLSISDTGCGMDQATLARIFDPFFTTKEVGKGTGLGMAVIHGIIKDYKGFIQVESEPGQGTTVKVYLPAREKEIFKAEEKEHSELPTGTEHILVVDDEKPIADMYKVVLERLGYTVSVATNSLDALETLRTNPDLFDLLVTDQTMPNLTGAELAQCVLQLKSSMPIILCSGYSAIISEKEALAVGIKKYVRKPIDRGHLAEIVRMVLDGD